MAKIDVKKLRELARRLRDTQADCADSIEAADAIVTLCDRLEAAEKQQESLTSLLAECRDAAYVEGYAENFLPAAIGSPDDVPAFVGQTVTELRTKLEAAEKDAGRYRWLRDDNAYAPEEACIRGDADLDELCDDGIALAQRQGEGS
ncbi:hypothetical protein WK07_16740 [Burkholderia multivorans]|uniref:hypothetical protein n=1 Tax=Burkholderia multivorans TaxID=87883 RepID=UPI000755A34A|nr:hypothetical protein [Burkholderia multivorans]KVQ78509.1 hypothetical protein WK07_16740 [Burkholderia multivorans]